MADGGAYEPPDDSYAPPAPDFQPRGGSRPGGVRVPPHNAEAEESVLGAMLLSSDAANTVIDRLSPYDFYVPAYQAIYEAMVELYNTSQPIDAVTVTDQLRRKDELDKIGGPAFIARLQTAVPVASRVDYYADIVEDSALRRSLIRAGGEITNLAHQTDEELDYVIDNAEQTVLGVAERRVGDGLLELSTMLKPALESIEALEANAGQ
ncbi:MAG: replicative DNA helicase, partial [Acidimicrobiia bacterium]|nr:replicative DNA helicase [Acidimicrobiia bacterium]